MGDQEAVTGHVERTPVEPVPRNRRFAEHVAALLRDGPPLDGVQVVEAVAVESRYHQWHVEVTLEDGSRLAAENFHAYRGTGAP